MIFDELMTGLNEAVGMESISDAPMTELEEMNAEIQDMIALESAFEEMEAYTVLEFADNVEATSALLAMREVALESTQGMDPAKIYEGFGIESEIAMEAAKDVLARKAYAGIAAIKALIATCIKWLKSLFGITVASKKVFTSLKKKADDMKKQLNKKAGSSKIDSEKLVRSIPDYQAGLKNWIGLFNNNITNLSNATRDMVSRIERGTLIDKNSEDSIETLNKQTEKHATAYKKSETEEVAGSQLITVLTGALSYLSSEAGKLKSKDPGKDIKSAIKELENYKKKLDNRDSSKDDKLEGKKASVNALITRLNKLNSLFKEDMKGIVRVSDDLLTMSKGVLAAIY